MLDRDFAFRVMPDFGDGRTSLLDGYLEWKRFPEAKVRVGRFKEPFGLERLQSATDIRFAEVALPSNLVPNRDIGVMVHGEFGKGLIAYQAGVFNGNADGASSDRDVDDEKDFAGRAFLNPLKDSDVELFQGLGIGAAVTRGIQDGAGALGTYKTGKQETFFRYRSDVTADGEHVRFSPQAYYYYGPFGLLGEWVRSSQDVTRNRLDERVDNTSWQVQAAYLLTGEKASYKSVDPKDPSWGAWEAVARYGRLEADGDAFPNYADPAVSAGFAKALGAGLNVYLNKNIKTMLDYERTSFDGGAARGDRRDESAAFVRFQVSF